MRPRALRRKVLALAALGLSVTPPASAQSVAELYSAGVEARGAGRFAEAVGALRDAALIEPENSDVLVQLGLSRLGAGDLEGARDAFERAVAIAPDYVDASLGLVRIAMRREKLGRARRLVDWVTARHPQNDDAALLSARVAMLEGEPRVAQAGFRAVAARDPGNVDALIGIGDAARARGAEPDARSAYEHALATDPSREDARRRLEAPAPSRWRLDIAGEISDLSGGRGDWSDSVLALSYQSAAGTTVTGQVRRVTRFGLTDIEFQSVASHAFTPTISAFALLAGAPDADVLAETSFGLGGTWRPGDAEGGPGRLALSLDAGHERFSDSALTTVSPALQVFSARDRFSVSARWIHSISGDGTVSDGYALRFNIAATERLAVWAGYADAPEISLGSRLKTETVFAGLTYDLTDHLGLRAGLSHERRATFDRGGASLGVTIRF